MSNYAKEACCGGRVILGPEVVNGTGQVYLDALSMMTYSNAEARELAAALIAAADYASARKAEEDQ